MGCFLSLDKSKSISLKDFQIERVIGKGGFGKVNAAVKLRGTDRGAMYAMKQLGLKVAMKNRKSEEVLFNERNILETLSETRHQRIANLHYAFSDVKYCYVVLDLALGGDLLYQSGKQKDQRFTERITQFYAAQMQEALSFIHSKHILHRDIKPENILLSPNGYVRLTDFGISKLVTADHPTYTGRSGTKGFMAPEIYEGKHSFAADYFALGVTLFFLSTGVHPFTKLPPIDWEPAEHLSAPMRACLSALMCKSPSDRIQNQHEFKKVKWFDDFQWNNLASDDIVPEFIPNLKQANCNTGHHDATDALFGEQDLAPTLTAEQRTLLLLLLLLLLFLL